MSFTEKRREEIKKYILRKIAQNDNDVLAKTMDSFGISVTTVKRYLQDALNENLIQEREGEGCPYQMVEREKKISVSMQEGHLEEDYLFEEYIAPLLTCCNDRAWVIWQYACAEILNNAIEHSKGTTIGICVRQNALNTTITIKDDGLGVFQTLTEYMAANGWENPRKEDALVELYKGKITSDCENHSGEGIFFTSKLVDSFELWSDSLILGCGSQKEPKTMHSHLAAYAARIRKERTVVVMTLENETERKAGEVFDMYADIDEGLIKTRIPVREACVSGEPVARSQARRICYRLEEFHEVVLDFSDVELMGQGFADVLFRVYACTHPQVGLVTVTMLPQVERLIYHVSRGKVAENICFPD